MSNKVDIFCPDVGRKCAYSLERLWSAAGLHARTARFLMLYMRDLTTYSCSPGAADKKVEWLMIKGRMLFLGNRRVLLTPSLLLVTIRGARSEPAAPCSSLKVMFPLNSLFTGGVWSIM